MGADNYGVAVKKARVFLRRSLKGFRNTTKYLAQKFARSPIRVKRQYDDVFREVDYSSILLQSFTLQELKEAIAARFYLPPNDIRALLKNGNVTIENDDDVTRLGGHDYIDVVFGNALPFGDDDLVPVYAPFNASLSQIV